MQLEDYTTGTVSIANGSTALTGSGTAWSIAGFKAGDTFHAQGLVGIVASVVSDTSITLRDAWTGAAISGGTYLLRFQSDNSRMQGTTRQLLDELRQGQWLTPDATGKTADKATYDARPAGFRFLDVSVDPFKLYVKQSDTSGDWSDGADWVGPKGDAGPQGADGDITWHSAWTTGTAYTTNQAVSNGGSSYVCITNHTSGTFATDLAAGKWELMAQKGDTGATGADGNFNGPSSATDGNLIVFDGATGAKGKDSGKKPGDFQAALNPTALANQAPYFDGSGAAALTALSAFARTVLDDANGAAVFTTMGAAQSLTTNGYQKLPSGLIIQWGTQQPVPTASDYNVTFPLAFPTACFSVVIGGFSGSTTELNMVGGVPTKTGFSVRSRTYTNGSGTGWIFWFAMGN